MKNIIKKSGLLIAILTLAANFSHAQLNGVSMQRPDPKDIRD